VIGAVDLGDSDRGTGGLPVPELISDALAEYRRTHGHQPARIVLHKPRSSVPPRSPGSKPRNLFLTPGGIVKVLDFGVAALLGAGELSKLTMAGQTVGTPPYMAPEQALASAVGPPADLYALGCVLHEMLTGQLPFMPSDGVSVLWHHVHTPPPPVRAIRPDVPAQIETLILKLLSKSPDERAGPDEVYDTLLPYAHADTAGFARGELDPTRPFTRPMAATPRRGTPAPAPLATAGPTKLSPSEAQAVTDQAVELAQAGQFSQATDILTAAIGRCAADALADELRFSLANVLFVAGSNHRGRQAGCTGMHARLSGSRQAGTRDRRGPSMAVRGKPTVHTDRPSGRTPSAICPCARASRRPIARTATDTVRRTA
jgi:Protein kinase domain